MNLIDPFVEAALDRLEPKHARALDLRFGLTSGAPMRRKDVSYELRCHPGYVNVLIKEAIEILRDDEEAVGALRQIESADRLVEEIER